MRETQEGEETASGVYFSLHFPFPFPPYLWLNQNLLMTLIICPLHCVDFRNASLAHAPDTTLACFRDSQQSTLVDVASKLTLHANIYPVRRPIVQNPNYTTNGSTNNNR